MFLIYIFTNSHNACTQYSDLPSYKSTLLKTIFQSNLQLLLKIFSPKAKNTNWKQLNKIRVADPVRDSNQFWIPGSGSGLINRIQISGLNTRIRVRFEWPALSTVWLSISGLNIRIRIRSNYPDSVSLSRSESGLNNWTRIRSNYPDPVLISGSESVLITWIRSEYPNPYNVAM